MQCSRCGREIKEEQSYAYQGRVLCEDCLMDIGLSGRECDPWASYVETSARKRRGLVGAEELGEMERKIYDFVRGQGRATRDEVMRQFGLSEAELKAQLGPLMHSELIKEQGGGGGQYLVPIV